MTHDQEYSPELEDAFLRLRAEEVKHHLSTEHQWPAAPIEEAEAIHAYLHDDI